MTACPGCLAGLTLCAGHLLCLGGQGGPAGRGVACSRAAPVRACLWLCHGESCPSAGRPWPPPGAGGEAGGRGRDGLRAPGGTRAATAELSSD